MKAIRRHLLGWLMPGFILLWAGAGVAIYAFAWKGLETRMESDLREIAAAFPGGGFQGSEGMQEFADYFSDDRGIYFQLWLPGNQTLLKSETLGAFELIPPERFRRIGEFDRQSLPSGDEVSTFAIQSRDDAALGKVNLMVAKSRDETREALVGIVVAILIGGGIGAVIFVGLLGLALRSGLEPLNTLGRQAGKMDASTLHERFPEAEAPEELKPILGRLNELMDRLEASFLREKRFSADLAHELRNPVAALKTTAEVALRWPDTIEAQDFEDIRVIAEDLQGTIENILSLVKLENMEASLQRSPTALRDLVEESWLLSERVAGERGIRLELEVPREARWETDARLLGIILNNLLSNAAEYAPEGSEITVRLDERGVLKMENEAPQLQASDLPKLFHRLWRHDSSRTGSSHSGLGLALARACSEALNLDLRAFLDPGGILRFRLEDEFGETSSSSPQLRSDMMASSSNPL